MLILAPNLNIFQRYFSQPLIEDISKFPILQIKSKIKIQKGKLIFVHAPQSENTLKIGAHLRKFSQNRFELISILLTLLLYSILLTLLYISSKYNHWIVCSLYF